MSTLYVGNLAWGTTQENLLAALQAQSQANIVSCDTGTVRNGRTRGWAIVECGDEEAANAVINNCNGMTVDERALTVRLDAKPEKVSGGAGGNTSGGASSKRGTGDPALVGKPEASSGTQIVVRNLAWNVTSEMLKGTFAQIGDVLGAEVVYHADSGRSKGWGTVKFTTPEDAQDAIQRFGGVELANRPMVCRMDRYN
eukprot:TRINITY_DN1748_c0_g1_i1.p1 TRINITY_DN1748_c0_g1~~TRINITY_DN1748_c0_g1_i1.p1  ORF type:complete len:198 (+),score=58.28 TRINITY_DN1748_c0_g1_i1:123-716(+)